MRKNIEQIDLGNNETISLAKGKFGYRVVHPHKDSNGKIIWINLLIGGWENFFKLLFIMFVILSFLYGVKQMNEGCREMAKNPCAYTNLDCTRVYKYLDNYVQTEVGGNDVKT